MSVFNPLQKIVADQVLYIAIGFENLAKIAAQLSADNLELKCPRIRRQSNPEQIDSRQQAENQKEAGNVDTQSAKAMSIRGDDARTQIIDDSYSKYFQEFVKQFQPQVFSKHPTAPLQRVNKVLLQKWNSLDKTKKEVYKRKVDKRRQQEKHPKRQEEGNQKQSEEVMVKREAIEEPQKEETQMSEGNPTNTFDRFLSRVEQNFKHSGQEQEGEAQGVREETENQPHNDQASSRAEEEMVQEREEREDNEKDAQNETEVNEEEAADEGAKMEEEN